MQVLEEGGVRSGVSSCRTRIRIGILTSKKPGAGSRRGSPTTACHRARAPSLRGSKRSPVGCASFEGIVQTLPPLTAPLKKQQLVLAELEKLKVGGTGGLGDRQIVMEALLSPGVPATTPTLVSADRQMINGLAKAAKDAHGADIEIDISRLGRYKNVAEYFHHEHGSRAFTVEIEGHTLRIFPIQKIRGDLK